MRRPPSPQPPAGLDATDLFVWHWESFPKDLKYLLVTLAKYPEMRAKNSVYATGWLAGYKIAAPVSEPLTFDEHYCLALFGRLADGEDRAVRWVLGCKRPAGYVQPSEPEGFDGHDYEGFPGGCTRMGCDPLRPPSLLKPATKAPEPRFDAHGKPIPVDMSRIPPSFS